MAPRRTKAADQKGEALEKKKDEEPRPKEKEKDPPQESKPSDDTPSPPKDDPKDEPKKEKTQLRGRLIDAATGKGIGGIYVELWVKGPAVQESLGRAKTKKDGAFKLDLDPEHLLALIEAGGVSLFAKILLRNELLACREVPLAADVLTRGVVIAVEGVPPGDDDDEEEDDDKDKGDKKKSKGTSEPVGGYVVRGQVRGQNGKPLAGARVRAFDKDLRAEELLGEATTDLCGFYQVAYTQEQFKRAEKDSADLVLRVYGQAPEPLFESAVLFNAPETAVVDLLVGGGAFLGPSEYDRFVAELTPVLAGVALGELTDADVTFLEGETGIPRDSLVLLRAAAGLARETELPIEAHYGLARRGLPTDLAALLATDAEAQRAALLGALDENLIPLAIRSQVEAILARLRQLAAERVVEEPPVEGTTPPSALLDTVQLSPSAQTTLFDRMLHDTEPLEEFWTRLGDHPDFSAPGTVDNVRTALTLGLLTYNHVPLVKYLQGTLGGAGARGARLAAQSLRDLANLDEAGWRAVLDQKVDGVPIGYPATTPGATPEEKKTFYASSLAASVEAAFPTATVAQRIARDALPGAGDLTRFFTQNPSFDLETSRVQGYVIDNPSALDGLQDKAATVARLAGTQRLHRLTRSYNATRALLNDGLDSARQISRWSEGDFVARYAPALGGAAQAADVHRRARHTAAGAGAIFALFGRAFATPDLAAVPAIPEDPGTGLTAAAASPVPADWRTLFNDPLAQCACAHCRSVHSPAAYLVDLLTFLASITAGETNAAAALFSRRADLAAIELSCDNTNTALPYVDLVHEILESVISPDTIAPARARQTSLSTAELAAHPQYSSVGRYEGEVYRKGAYDLLAEAQFPWTLPFDLPAQEVRTYLRDVDLSRETLLETFAARTGLDPLARADERLGLTAFEHQLITGNNHTDVAERVRRAWGLDAPNVERLQRVSELLERSRLNYDELREVLDTDFLRALLEGEEHFIVSSDKADPNTCDPAKLIVPSLHFVALDRIHRFVRLWRASGIAIADLDRAIALLSESEIDDAFLIELAALLDLSKTLALAVPDLLGLWDADAPNRTERLAAALGLSAAELATLQALTATDPFARPTTTALFVTRARKAARAPLDLTQLEYVYRHVASPSAAVALPREDVVARLRDIQDGLGRITDETHMPAEPTLDLFARRMASAFNPAQAERLVGFVRGFPLDTPENQAFIRVELPFVESAAALLLTSAPVDEAARAAYLRSAAALLLERLLSHVRSTSSEGLVKQVLSDALQLDSAMVGALLSEHLVARTDPAKRALADYLALLGNGVSATYFADLELGNPKATRIEPRIAFDWGTAPPAPDVPAGRFSARWSGRVFVPGRDAVTFFVRTSGGVRLKVGGVALIDQWDNRLPAVFESTPTVLAATKDPDVTAAEEFYDLELEYRTDAPSPFLELGYSGPAVPRSTVPTKHLFANADTSFVPMVEAYTRLHKAALLINALGLSPREVAHLAKHKEDFGGFDLNDLPVEPTGFSPALFAAWERLQDLVDFRRRLKRGDHDLLDVFAAALSSEPTPKVTRLVASLTGWSGADLDALIAGLGLGPQDFRNEEWLAKLGRCFDLARRTELPVTTLLAWARASLDGSLANSIKEILAARYERAEWLRRATVLRDELREKQRRALVAYLVARPSLVPGASWRNENGLFNHYLVDVEMSPCALTSRVKLAIGSVQLFVQRCLMNVDEVDVRLSAADAKHWREWMHSYRLWEANRKVFLYPENWIRPELRRDKSPFFQDLENELLQSDISEDAAEQGLQNYLAKLDEVARLEIVGLYHEVDSGTNTNNLHIFGRTRGMPHRYYYRKRVGQAFYTAWQKVDLDIEGDHLIPVVYQRRLHLFWAIFSEKSESAEIPQAQGRGGAPQTHWSVKLAWSVHSDGGWTQKRVGEAEIGLSAQRVGVNPNYWRGFVRLTPQRHSFRTAADHAGRLTITCYVTNHSYLAILRPLGDFNLECNGDMTVRDAALSGSLWRYTGGGTTQRAMAFVEQASVLGDSPLYLPLHPFVYEPYRPPAVALYPTPGTFVLMPSNHDPLVGDRSAFFYQDATRTFVARPQPPPIATLPPVSIAATFMGTTAPLALAGNLKVASHGWTQQAYVLTPLWKFETFYHPHVCVYQRELGRYGVAGLYRRELQVEPWRVQPVTPHLSFAQEYAPRAAVVHPTHPTENVDFSFGGAYSLYNWELFFHVPFFVADRLSQNQRFEAAQAWFHYMFDPTDRSSDIPGPARFWRFRPFREAVPTTLENFLKLGSNARADENAKKEFQDQITVWKANPFDPHAVARLRVVAYQKAVVMQYIDNLVAWADQLFRRDTIESINQATLLYVLASELLGPRPKEIPPRLSAPALSFEELHAQRDDFLVSLEHFIPDPPPIDGDRSRDPELLTAPYYFCVPKNEKLMSYWDVIAERLFFIRHCRNIEGVFRQLPSFEPPLDVGALVRAAAAGVDLASAISETEAALPHYRFAFMLPKAMELCADLKQLGAALLAALEKRDAEALGVLRSGHEIRVLEAVRQVRTRQVAEAKETLASLQKAHEVTSIRREHYADRSLMNEWEITHLALMGTATVLEIARGIVQGASSATEAAFPDLSLGAAGWAASPVTVTSLGGRKAASALDKWSSALGIAAQVASTGASMSASLGSHQQRKEEWDLQGKLAAKELEQLDKQIQAARIRVELAEKELANHDLATKNAKEVDTFLRDKFTRRELYDWMVSQISAVYFQSYQLTYDMARRAQRAYQFELGNDDSFVQFGYWDSLKKGLLAGEKLYHDLKRLEIAHLEKNRREYEIAKHISLALVDPMALVALRDSGECFVSLPEELFDLDFPGHHMRRLKVVGVSVPCVTGPYTSVNCTLTLLDSSVRRRPTLANGRYERARDGEGVPKDDERFVDHRGAIQSVVTSTGREDTGLFETNLRDERYLPFEGQGAVSRWRIQLPKEDNAFDFGTVTDVVLHLRYTAREGGEALKQAARTAARARAARNGVRLFLVPQEFSEAWHRFVNTTGDNAPHELVMDFGPERFPMRPGGRSVKLTRLMFLARAAQDAPAIAGELVLPSNTTQPLSWAPGAEPRRAEVVLSGAAQAPGTFGVRLDAGAQPPEDLAVVAFFETVMPTE